MICKERNPSEHPEHDKFSEAGAKAEAQMAFYLRRAFANDSEVRIFHDLRFVDQQDDAVQIDHLVLHPHCIIVIESKSVTSEVRVNKHQEWTRVWHGQESGIPSPILQSRRQADRLRDILNAYAEELNIRRPQNRFHDTPFQVLVGISDSGIIRRDIDLPEISKADQVPSRALEIIAHYKKAAQSPQGGKESFTDGEIQTITAFLLKYHYPLKRSQPSASAAPPPNASTVKHVGVSTPVGRGKCEKCSAQSTILWGRYGYYWKCPSCQTNMPINEYCPKCRGKLKLRKDKQRFYIYCEPCKALEELYYTGQ